MSAMSLGMEAKTPVGYTATVKAPASFIICILSASEKDLNSPICRCRLLNRLFLLPTRIDYQ